VVWRPKTYWQRAILNALKEVAAFYLTDLLPARHTLKEADALNRATRELAAAGKIAVLTASGGGYGKGEAPAGFAVTIYRAGDAEPLVKKPDDRFNSVMGYWRVDPAPPRWLCDWTNLVTEVFI
jgi:hypothetical protein